MAATRICKICGREYPFCYTNRHDNAFRWQDVACCPEHGTEYFNRIAASRQFAADSAVAAPSESESEELVEIDESEDAEDEEEDEEEEDEE